MSRAVFAVLIAAPDVVDATPSAVETSIAELDGYLRRRFGAAVAKIDIVGPRDGALPRPSDVLAAIDGIVALAPKPGDLFVIAYAGHAIEASRDHPYQSWRLDQGEVSDTTLLRRLRLIDRDVEIVLVAGCCYAEGLFKGGEARLPRGVGKSARRRQRAVDLDVARAMAVADRRLSAKKSRRRFVLVSGAALSKVIYLRHLATFVSSVMVVADRRQSYRKLRSTFRVMNRKGTTFGVSCRPGELLHTAALAP